MEELNNKLQSMDPTVISLFISKLVENLEQKHERLNADSEQLSFLQSKCMSADSKINEIAAEGILKLVSEGKLDATKLLEEFITLIPNNKISKGVVKTICGILYHQFLSCERKFNMYVPQHPLITLLISNSECFPHIYKELRFASTRKENSSWNMWNYSFYQYCFCNPLNKKPMFYKMKIWMNLLSSREDDELVMKLISWMPLDPSGSLLVSSELLNELSNVSNSGKIETEVVLMLQVSVLYKLVSKGHDPRETVLAIRQLLNRMERIDCANVLLLVLVKAVSRASSSHAWDVLQICQQLLDRPNINFYVLQCLKASLLHWIGNPSSLSVNVCSKASEIYNQVDHLSKNYQQVDSCSKDVYEKYEEFIITNRELTIAFELMRVCESDRESVLDFLKKLEGSSLQFTKKLIHFVYGVFVCDPKNDGLTSAAFKIIRTYVENYKESGHSVLTLILYNLSSTSRPKIHFELFEYLPKLAGVSENYLKVVTTLKVLHGSSDYVLKTFGMRLMYDLWRNNANAYPFLEEMLTEEEPIKHNWEFYINKAHIVKQICEVNSKIYGKEMVAHLSRILNKCSGGEGELASAIAIDAIAVLCSEGVIDITTTWLTLAPNYLKDKRTKTVKSMCNLAAVISHLMHPEHHKDLQKEVICKMWDYAVNSSDDEVKKAALNALAAFGLENISPYFPEQYITEENVSKTEVTPQLVTGSCWINFLKDQADLTTVGDFLINMIKKEVDEYPKYVYHITSRKEPTDYSLLPSHSLVRGVVGYCNTQSKRWKGLYKHVFIECMRILSQEYSKPLPPYNWSFLQELFHEPELKKYCVTIACHQVMISGTARRFVESYINSLTEDFKNVDEVLLVYENLKYLANSIQPVLFEAFFQNTLNYAQFLKTEKLDGEILVLLIGKLRDTLADPSVQDVSKKGIVSVIDAKLQVFRDDEIFRLYLSCVPCYPVDLLKNITNLPITNYDMMPPEIFRKAVSVRCKLATGPKGKLKWLDDLLDIHRSDSRGSYSLEKFLQVFNHQKDQSECVEWTMDLIGRIEAAVAENASKTYTEFLILVLLVAIVSFSGFHIFVDDISKIDPLRAILHGRLQMDPFLKLLPQAAATLLENKEWSHNSSRVMEFFYFLNVGYDGPIPKGYKNAFGQSLQALRHHPEFKKGVKWMKYLNAEIVIKKLNK